MNGIPLFHLKDELNDRVNLAVIFDSGERFSSDAKGIFDLLNIAKTPHSLQNAVAADKIVGRAAAFLYCRCNVKYLYAETLSEGGEKILKDNGISYSFGSLAPAIMNRTGTGICPMDDAVKDIDDTDTDTAYTLIFQRAQELRKNQG